MTVTRAQDAILDPYLVVNATNGFLARCPVLAVVARLNGQLVILDEHRVRD